MSFELGHPPDIEHTHTEWPWFMAAIVVLEIIWFIIPRGNASKEHISLSINVIFLWSLICGLSYGDYQSTHNDYQSTHNDYQSTHNDINDDIINPREVFLNQFYLSYALYTITTAVNIIWDYFRTTSPDRTIAMINIMLMAVIWIILTANITTMISIVWTFLTITTACIIWNVCASIESKPSVSRCWCGTPMEGHDPGPCNYNHALEVWNHKYPAWSTNGELREIARPKRGDYINPGCPIS
jgi:hypothetical protein